MQMLNVEECRMASLENGTHASTPEQMNLQTNALSSKQMNLQISKQADTSVEYPIRARAGYSNKCIVIYTGTILPTLLYNPMAGYSNKCIVIYTYPLFGTSKLSISLYLLYNPMVRNF